MKIKKTARRPSLRDMIFTAYFYFFLLLILAIILLSCGVIDSIMFTNKKLKTTSELDMHLSTVTSTVENDVSLCWNLSENEKLLQLLRSFSEASDNSQVQTDFELSEFLKDYSYYRPEIMNIRIYTNQKIKTGNSLKTVQSFGNVDPSLFTNSEENNGLLLCVKSITGSSSEISIITPIIDYSREILGYLCINLEKDSIFSLMSLGLDNTENIYIMNNNEEIIAAQYIQHIQRVVSDRKTKGINEKNGAGVKRSGGVYLFYSAANAYGWKAVEIERYSQVMKWRWILFSTAFLIICAFIFAVRMFSKKSAQKLAKPLERLSLDMDKSVKTEIDAGFSAEVADLCGSYNTLLVKNDTLINEIRQSQEERKNALMQSLMAQINPHFLYNTLNTITWRAMAVNCPEICSIISKLSQICRMNYNFSTTCTLRDEITHINLYMDLQCECLKNKFDYSIDVPEEYCGCEIPKFILQPIVENSIIHGFSQIDRKGRITITAYADEVLQIIIKDNGSGIPAEILRLLNSNSFHSQKYGIFNVNERIRLICGSEYGIEYRSVEYRNTEAIITLPIKEQKTEVKRVQANSD